MDNKNSVVLVFIMPVVKVASNKPHYIFRYIVYENAV